MDPDVFDSNPFYTILQSKHLAAFRSIQLKGGLVCVPTVAALEQTSINKNFIESHLLIPSPFLQENFLSSDKHSSRTVIRDGNYLVTGNGFKSNRKIEVLLEEVGYSEDGSVYHTLLLNRNLLDKKHQVSHKKCEVNECQNAPTTLQSSLEFLKSSVEWTEIFHKVDSSVQQFTHNYLLLGNYLHEANEKLQSMCNQHRKMFLDTVQKNVGKEKYIDTALECYILSSVYTKLFPVISELCSEKESQLSHRIELFNGVESSVLGINIRHDCSIKPAALILMNIESFKNPLEKMQCMKDTLNSITVLVQKHIKLMDGSYTAENFLTTDDLLPLLASVLVSCTGVRMVSSVHFVKHFYWSMTSGSQEEFTLVTYTAAIEYLLSIDVCDMKLKKKPTIKNGARLATLYSPGTSQSSFNRPSKSRWGSRDTRQVDSMFPLNCNSTEESEPQLSDSEEISSEISAIMLDQHHSTSSDVDNCNLSASTSLLPEVPTSVSYDAGEVNDVGMTSLLGRVQRSTMELRSAVELSTHNTCTGPNRARDTEREDLGDFFNSLKAGCLSRGYGKHT